jgi:hypothetical protein
VRQVIKSDDAAAELDGLDASLGKNRLRGRQEGHRRSLDPDGEVRASIVFDNLIHRGEMPVTIGVFVDPGEPENRNVEYDAFSDAYATFLLAEMLRTPAAGISGSGWRPTSRCPARNGAGASRGRRVRPRRSLVSDAASSRARRRRSMFAAP